MNPGLLGFSTSQIARAAPLSTFLTADSGSFTAITNLLSLTLTRGVWMVFAGAHLVGASGATNMAVDITDGTNHYGSAATTSPAATFTQQLSVVSEPITVGSVVIISLAAQGSLGTIARATTLQGSVEKATWMRAIQIA